MTGSFSLPPEAAEPHLRVPRRALERLKSVPALAPSERLPFRGDLTPT